MAIIKCPECGAEISDRSTNCVKCGCPISGNVLELKRKANLLWSNKQYQECLSVCNEIILQEPTNYLYIFRIGMLRRLIENDIYLGLDEFKTSVKQFHSTKNHNKEEAEAYTECIRFLFSNVIHQYNSADEMESNLNFLQSKGIMGNAFAGNLKGKGVEQVIRERRAYAKEWSEVIYREFPVDLLKVASNAEETYSFIISNTAVMNRDIHDELREKHPDIVKESKAQNTGCYIATCVYGSYDCPQVWTLRRYRDSTLTETWYGRAFIRCYYAISPTLVKWFGNTAWFKNVWKGKLDRMIAKLNADGIENTPYHDINW